MPDSPSIHDLDACQRVALLRRGGIPDTMIASELGLTIEALRRACPDAADNPLGLPPRPAPHRPGFKGAPLDLTPLAAPSSGGDGLAVLLLLWLLSGG